MPNFQEPYNQFSESDEEVLRSLVSEVKEGMLCEVGCWTGHSTSIISEHAKNIGSKVIVVDNFCGNEGTPLLEYAKDNKVIDMFKANMDALGLWKYINLFVMNSGDAHQYIKDKSLGFIFIDACHTYEDVKNDLINYIPKMKDGAVICGHDYESNTYDERYINEDYVDGKHHGVIKAVNEILGEVEYKGRMWWVKSKSC